MGDVAARHAVPDECFYCSSQQIHVLSFINMEYIKNSKFSFQQHPLRQSTRLPGYNYTQPGAYFITICTHKHQLLLGNVSDGVMLLNTNGKIVQACWTEITEHFSNTELSVYVIMPNHFHGIIVINSSDEGHHAISHDVGISSPITISESFGKPVSSSLPTIIRSFKSAVTRRVNISLENRKATFWQKGYYEHIIRSEEELVQIGEYIVGNPMKWEIDRENPYLLKILKPQSFEY